MKIRATFSGLVLIIVVVACDTSSTDVPITSVPGTSTSPANSPSEFVAPTVGTARTSTPGLIDVTQPAIEEIEWATYEFDAGVTFKYPHDWIIMESREDEHSVEFFVTAYLPYNVRVDVYHQQERHDPHADVPNEGRYEVLWEKPISIENADGLEYIWGIPAVNQIGGILIAMYYSEQYELAVMLRTDADAIPTESNRFSVFEYMVQSVRITP